MFGKILSGLTEELCIKWIIVGLVILGSIIGFFYYGHLQYEAGENAADMKWKQASIAAQESALAAANSASDASFKRVIEHNDAVTIEKEKLDEAEKQGTSPFDVLFPGSN